MPTDAPRSTCRRGAAIAAALAALALAGPAGAGNVPVITATSPPLELVDPPASYDLLFDADAEVDGANGIPVGNGVSTGDVNGDGIEDTVSEGVVIFGDLPPLLDLAGFPGNGFRISGRGFGAQGFSDTVVGDLNGDGLAEIATTTTDEDLFAIVFGKADTASVNATNLGGAGFHIQLSDGDGYDSIARAGDVNRDRFGDLIVGDGGAARNGRAYVVFGGPDTTTVVLSSLGSRGYEIQAPVDQGGVAYAGDVNGDGTPDQLVGSPIYDDRRGAAWVVFGKANTLPIDVDALGGAGYRIRGYAEAANVASEVAYAGDVNGDGVPDHLIAEPRGGEAAYVVFGQRSSTATITLGGGTPFEGFEILPPADDGPGDGFEITGLDGDEDVNRDGRADVIVASAEDGTLRPGGGTVWVVYGKKGKKPVDLETTTNGFRIDGPTRDARLGTEAAFHDVGNRVNVVMGAPGASPNGLDGIGALFEVDGRFVPPPLDRPIVESRLVLEAERIVAGAGAGSAVLSFRARRAVTVRASLVRLVEGRRRPPTGRCFIGETEKRRARCVVVQRVKRATLEVAKPAKASLPLRATLTKGTYLLRVVVTDPKTGKVFGPYRASFRVKG